MEEQQVVDQGTEVVAEEPAFTSHTYEQDFTQEQLDVLISMPPDEKEPVPADMEATPDEETQETEQPTPVEEGKDEIFTIDDKEYSLDDISRWRKDSENRHEWQKSNTEKSQSISDERKALNAEIEKWKTVKDNDDLMEAIKDYLGEDAESHPLFMESSKVSESQEEPTDGSVSEVEQLRQEMSQMKAKMEVEQDIQKLQQEHPELRNNEEALNEVIKTMLDRNLPTLEDAYLISNAKATENSAFSKAKQALEEAQKAKEIPVVKGNERGQRSKPVPKMESYRDIREHALENYDLFR